MKKYILSVMLLVCAVATAFAQAGKAKLFLEEGKLDKAKETIEAATQHEKQKLKAETWYVRGMVYLGILSTKEEQYKSLSENPIKEVLASFDKVKELDKANGSYITKVETTIPGIQISGKDQLYNAVFQKGADAQDEPEEAYKAFKTLHEIFPTDTAALKYGARFAYIAEKYQESADMSEKLIANPEYKNMDVYQYAILSYEQVEKNDRAMELARTSMEKFPTEIFFMSRVINGLIRTEKYQEAIDLLHKAVAKDDKNVNLYWNLGILYQEIQKEEDALKYYTKGLELDKENYESNFGIGAIHYNRGANLLNSLDYKVYQNKQSNEMKQVMEHFTKSLPFMEKADKLKANNLDVLRPLKKIYDEMGRKTEAAQVEAKLKTLMGGGDE